MNDIECPGLRKRKTPYCLLRYLERNHLPGTLQRLPVQRRQNQPVALFIQKGDAKAWIASTALIQTAHYAARCSAGFRNVYAAHMLLNRQAKTADYVSQGIVDMKKGWIK